MKLLKEKKYEEAHEIFTELDLQHPYSRWATKGQLMSGFSLYKANKYDEAIFVFEKFPSSTYENIIMVGNELKRLKYENIIFITSPYHYKRSILIWNKNFPNLKIFPAKNVSFSLEKYKWDQNFDEIKITM